MNSPNLPPPLPPDVKGNRSAGTVASVIALVGPFLMMVLLVYMVSHYAGKEDAMRAAAPFAWAAGGVLFVFGFGASIYLIVRSSRFARPLQSRGILGVVLHACLMFAIMQYGLVTAKVKAQKNREQEKEIQAAVKQITEDTRRAVKAGTNNNAGQEHFGRMQQQYEKASAVLTGNDKLAYEAGAAYMGRMQAETKKYEDAAERMRQAEVLSPSSNRTREQIAQNRQLVQDFVTANLSFSNFFQHADVHFAEELKARNIPERVVEQNVNGFNRTSADKLPFVIRIRKTDGQIGQATLELLAILDDNFGRWREEPGSGKLILPDDDVIKRYNDLLVQIDEAAEEQQKTREKLFKLK